MGKTKERCRENQWNAEQNLKRLVSVLKTLGLLDNKWFCDEVSTNTNHGTNEKGGLNINFDDPF